MPLNTSLENVYLATFNAVQYKKPAPKDSTEAQKQTGKFCRFHDSYGHTIDECRHLQDAIEKLFRQKKLQQFVKKSHDDGEATSDPNRGQAPRQPEGRPRANDRLMINTIIGGPHPADRSWNEMKRYANSLKHEEFECYTNTEDETPVKQQLTHYDR